MEYVLLIVLIYFAPSLFWRVANGIRFQTLSRNYLALWELLSRDEQIQVLYAEHGIRLRHCYSDFQGKGVTENDPARRSLNLDRHLDRVADVAKEIEEYELLSNDELTQHFERFLHEQGKLLAGFGDYPNTRAMLAHIFDGKTELASMAKQELNERYRREKHQSVRSQ